ncbi:MAG: leucyl aminopeptidase [Bryobacterales bacterium]|nr:leucyl aminopeptidase [Bryobacterales bacterium]
MQIALNSMPLEHIETEALAVIAYQADDPEQGLARPTTRRLDEATGGWLTDLYRSGELTGKANETLVLHRPPNLRAKRLVIVGGGKRERFGGMELRRAAGALARALRSRSIAQVALALEGSSAEVVAAAEGLILGDYEPDRYKTEKKNGKPLAEATLVVPSVDGEQQAALERARVVAETQNWVRDLVAEPANRMTPTLLAERAREMAAQFGLECDVLDSARMQQLGMGALLGVAQGSAEPPVLIVLRYQPQAAGEGRPHLGLIGKAVTFDSGGISLKPAENMDKMKYDMAGGAAVIGAMRVFAQLKPAIAVTALVPAVENMPGGRAQRPGDVVKTLSGKTVEVLNTDAEGRLIMADAMTYAQRSGCTHLVDAATLTGAIVVALGHVNAGAFGNDQALLDRVLAAARTAGEKLWPMPLDDEYKELLKSVVADMSNVGNRWAGAITAAMFLKEFADPLPWVHLDNAGTAWLEDSKPYLAKGPTGFPMRTLVQLVLEWR